MGTFTITRKLDLPAEKVWATVSDFNRAPSPAIIIEVEKEGDPEASGIGAIRNITIGRAKARERLESVDAPNSITYRMLSGAPVKEYVGTVEIKAQEDSTILNWYVKLTPKIPGIGWIVGMVIKKAINRFIDAIEEGYR